MRIQRIVNISVLAVVCVILAVVNASAADNISAFGWVTQESIVNSATGASAASLGLSNCNAITNTACTTGNAQVTFTTTGVNFGATGATVGAWLGTSAFTLDNLVDSVPSDLMDATIWEFTGHISVTNGATFTINHDDGATLIIDGLTVVNAPGPSSPATVTGTYSGATDGNATFTLYYSECCGGPAVIATTLLTPLTTPVPEPSSVVLFGTGLAFLGGMVFVRRRRQAADTATE